MVAMTKLYKSREWMRLRYVVQKKTTKEIAKECGVAEVTIWRYLEEFGFVKNKRGRG